MKRMWSLIAFAFIGYICLVVILFLLQDRMVYFPIRWIATTPSDIGLAYEPVWLEASDGIRLSGWFIPANEARGTILFFHGNAGNISHRLDSIAIFNRLGLNVFIIDYRGYGQSEGKPSEPGTYIDAEAAWRYLVDERRLPPNQIILFGRSLGGAVAAWLAQQHPPAALIVESTFTSVPDVAAKHYPFLPVRLLARIRYNTLAHLPETNCPVLIVHSPDDEIIPYSHGERLFAAAQEPKDFLKLSGGHNDGIFVSGPAYEMGLDSFITKYVGQ